jgi:hypothetical protein
VESAAVMIIRIMVFIMFDFHRWQIPELVSSRERYGVSVTWGLETQRSILCAGNS